MTQAKKSPKLPPLGVRLKNPCCIKSVRGGWLGQIAFDDKGHAKFMDDSFGFRAAARDIIGDILDDGKNTLRKLTAEYAPKTDTVGSIEGAEPNDPGKYAMWLEKATGVPLDEDLTPRFKTGGWIIDERFVFHLLLAMNIYECGAEWRRPDEEIWYGIYMYTRDFAKGDKR